MVFLVESEVIDKELMYSLRAEDFTPLTTASPHPDCRVCITVPVRNEADGLTATIRSFAQQVDSSGRPLESNLYEVLMLANNCSDDSAQRARAIAQSYPKLNLQVIEACLPEAIAHVGTARRLVMNEAYRRLAKIGLAGRIIAATDGDTIVASNWISTLISEFDQGVDAVGGRILTRRATDLELTSKVSLYFLRRLAYQYLTAQIEAFLAPQSHDCWPRHFQYYGANMSVLAEVYGKIGGLPPLPQEEDVALYQRLQQIDAKIRHSPDVRVFTSARRVGRATGGLAELMEKLTELSAERRAVLVEPPAITEARILVREQLRQFWLDVNGASSEGFVVRKYAQRADLLGKSLGLSASELRQEIEHAPTFGALLLAVERRQQQCDGTFVELNTEISLANMHLRQLLQTLRQQADISSSQPLGLGLDKRYFQSVLQALKQVETIPIFSLRF